MNRIQAGYIVGVGFVALGLIFGYYVLGPCWTPSYGGGEVCSVGIGSLTASDTESFLLSWGLIILGIGILVVSLLMRLRTQTTQNGAPK